MFERRRTLIALFLLIALPLLFFWQITLGQGVWFGNDIVRTYHPLAAELARALTAGRLPLWTNGIYGGMPILADAQIAALYPVNWLLYRFLPAHVALSYNMLVHLVWAAVGMFLLARALGLRTASAFLAGFVFAFNGFMFARLEHAAVLIASAWVPWSIFFWTQFQNARAQKSKRAGRWFALTAIALAMPVFAGFPQVAWLAALAFGAFALFGAWNENRFALKSLAPIFFAGISAIGIAAAQLAPTLELAGFSPRGNPSFEFATSYSLPVDFLPQFVLPFLRGEPQSGGGNNEYWAYVGIAPFVLTVLAPFLRRDRRTIFIALFTLGALSLALGSANPVYQIIYRVPGLNFFRVPARYLLLVVFGAALLSGIALDEIANRFAHPSNDKRLAPIIVLFGGAFIFVLWLGANQPIAFWLSLWQVLPIVLLAATIGILLLARRVNAPVLLIGVTILDLACLAPVFNLTLGQIVPPASAAVVPRSLAIMNDAPGRARVYADPSIYPSVPAIRNSLFPNAALVFNKESADAYSSLDSARHLQYVNNFSPAMLNAMNVRFWTIPLEPRPPTKIAFPAARVALDVLNREEIFAPTPANAIEIFSFTENAEQLADGTPVAQIEMRRRDGQVESFALRAGIETADWDAERKSPQAPRAPVVHSFPAFWRAFGRAFEGHTYRARFAFAPGEIISIQVRVLAPDAHLTIEGITLYNADAPTPLAMLVGKNNFRAAYFSDTVAVWENLNVLPRAFIVHAAEIIGDDAAFKRMREPAFDPAQTILLADGAPIDAPQSSRDTVQLIDYQPERVELSATTEQPGYLFLGDSWFPGWQAFVDGRATPIYRADVLFRAVPLEPGAHTIVFEYRPQSFTLGVVISLGTLVALAMIALVYLRKGI